MSAERGKPVMLTHGERRLLIELCENAIDFRESLASAYEGHEHRGAVKEAIRVDKLRIRQYRRLVLELSRAASGRADGGEGQGGDGRTMVGSEERRPDVGRADA